MRDTFGVAVDSTARKIRLAGDINMAVSDMLAADRGVLLYTHEKNAAGVAASERLFADRVALLNRDAVELRPLVSSEEELRALDVVFLGNKAWQDIFQKMEQLSAAGDVGAASRLEADKAMPVYHELDDVTDKLQDMQLSLLKNNKERAAGTFSFNRIVSFAFLVLASLAVWLVILWLNCRGKFMFLHCVVCDRAEVEVPWHKYAAAGNSLFRFRIALALAVMLLMLPLLGFLVADILRMVLREEADLPGVMLAVGLGLALVLFGIVCAIIHKFIVDFIVPLMFLRGGTCVSAWREFLGMLGARPGQFVIYLLFQIVLHIVISILIIMAFLVTCCIACCLLIIPFLGTGLLLPILIFRRAFSLYFLAQFGPQYDVFAPPPAPSQPAAPPP